MKPQFDAHTSLVADLIAFWWTPLFVIVFLAIVTYALWPNNARPSTRLRGCR